MMSIAAGYGRRARVAKVIFTLVLATGLTGAQAAEPVRLLVLGDSLAAGYGLADEGLHAPNEHFSLTNFYHAIHGTVRVLRHMAAIPTETA